jgi:hypothetical protein
VNNLYAFGCSNTYGIGLKDCWDPIKKGGDFPSQYAWPKLLADRLSLNCVNISREGASNKEITRNILESVNKINKDDVIIVLWSYLSRWSVFRNDHVEKLAGWDNSKNSQFWFKNLYNQADREFDNKVVIDFISLLLKKHELKFYFIIPDAPTFSVVKFNDAKFLKVTFDSIKAKFPSALDNVHVGEDGMMEFASRIYNEIKEDIKHEA